MLQVSDPEVRLALAYAPAGRRAALAALFALDDRFAAIVAAAREPTIGQMRLVWWRDALERLDTGPPPGEPLLQEIAGTILPAGVSGADLAAMEAGWAVLLPTEDVDGAALMAHRRDRGERLFDLAGRLLGAQAVAGGGAIWSMADLRRRGLAPHAAPSPVSAATGTRWPAATRSIGMLARLARRDLSAAGPEPQGSPARMLAMVAHRLTGY